MSLAAAQSTSGGHSGQAASSLWQIHCKSGTAGECPHTDLSQTSALHLQQVCNQDFTFNGIRANQSLLSSPLTVSDMMHRVNNVYL